MSTEEQAREVLTQQRHHDEHLKETMLNRAETEAENFQDADSLTQQQARELLAQQRQRDEHLKETMLNRTESEISTTETSAT